MSSHRIATSRYRRAMTRTFAGLIAAAVLALPTGGYFAGQARADSPAKPAATRVLGAVTSGLTVNGKTTLNGPVTVNSDGSNSQSFQVFDHAGNPIFTVPPFGGPAVLGDNFRLIYHGQIFNQALTLWQDGSITLGQSVGDPRDPADPVRNQGGPTLYGGSADPNVTPPAHAGHDFVQGDRYFRTNGDTLAYLGGVWVVR